MANNLIMYYSRTGENYVNGSVKTLEKGNTEYCAEFIQRAVGGDLFQIETVKEYAADYFACIEEAKTELKQKERPELKKYLDNVDDYDNIFICGPCWWGLFPMAIYSQVERLNWDGKRVNVLVTHEGSGLGSCEKDIKKTCEGAAFGKGLAVHGADAPHSEKAVFEWAKSQV